MTADISTKLAKLRDLMRRQHLDFYFVPARDAHNNEYVPECWQRRAWITGFTGSAGDALIGLNNAYLWTDSRYFLQAEQQLDSTHFQLMRQAQGNPPLEHWFLNHAQGQICGVDPRLISVTQATQWQSALDSVHGKLLPIDDNLIDTIWQEQPLLPTNPIRQYPLAHAGTNAQEKLIALRKYLAEKNVQALVLSQLDTIAWLFNIRGTDVEYNPLAISYAIISPDDTILFIDPVKISSADQLYLQSQQINTAPYTHFQTALRRLTGKIWLDPNSSWWITMQLEKTQLLLEMSPIQMMKATKNAVEIEGMREAHRRDALAEVKFFHWLENNWGLGVTEMSAADQLETFRRADPECLDLSFATISGFAANSAIVHYRSTPATNQYIDDTNLYLSDSGGQYLYGTTDITRTIHLGTPTEIQKLHYTLVLKGHLALRHTIFPAGTCGEHLDVLARHPLWQAGLNYGHGTGHGVGCYLCVHEGPQRISPGHSKIPLVPNMVVSNEPGVYFPEEYGIRIENLCVVVEHSANEYTFEDLTLVPYALNLIDTELLTSQEIAWINDYHREVFAALADDLNDEQREWLLSATAPL